MIKTKDTEQKTKLLGFVTAAATADSEEDFEAFLKVLNPSDNREDMAVAYETALGYNPITAFDFNDLLRIVDDITVDADSSIQSLLKGHKEEITDRAMEIFESRRESQLKYCVALAACEILGNDLGDNVAEMLGVEIELPEYDGSDEDDDDEDTGMEISVDEDLSIDPIPVDGEEFLDLDEEDDDE